MSEQTPEVKAMLEQVAQGLTESVIEKVLERIPEQKNVISRDQEVVDAKKQFAQGLKSLEAGEIKAMSSGTATEGAEMMPTHIADQMERVQAATGLVDKYATKWPMVGGKENIPTASSVVGYRVDENGRITTSQPVTGTVSLSSKTAAVIIPVSKKLLRNASPKLVDALMILAGEAFATLKDKWALLGLASGEGVFQNTSVPVVTMSSGDTAFSDITPEYLLDLDGAIDENVNEEGLRYVFSRSVRNLLLKQRNSVSGDFLFMGYGAQLPPSMWNIPYSTSPVMPKVADSAVSTKFAALVDFKKIIDALETSMVVEKADQGVISASNGTTTHNLFQDNMVALKFSMDMDLQLADPDKAFSVLKTAAA